MNFRKPIYALPAIVCAGAVFYLSAQPPAPKVGGNAKIQATEAAVRASRQDPDSVARGRTLFVSNCGFCHGETAKGTDIGPDLMRSATVLDDEKGELLFPKVRNHTDKKAITANLTDAQLTDINAWLKVQYYGIANRNTYQYLVDQTLVGNAATGKTLFEGKCASCHSVTGDLAGIGGKYDPPTLQGRWISGAGGRGGGGRGGRGGAPAAGSGGGDPGSTVLDETPPVIGRGTQTVTVTLADGQHIDGVSMGANDFNIAIKDMQGKYHSWTVVNGFPKVVVHNPLKAHGDILRALTDDDMHNITSYLATIK